MRQDTKIARRYAKAFFLLAIDEQSAGQFFEELTCVEATAVSVPELVTCLADKDVTAARRHHLVSLLQGPLKLSPMTVNFFQLLIDKERMELLPHIITAYRQMWEDEERLASAELTVAFSSVADEAAERVRTILEKLLAREARCSVKVRPDILGGFIVKVGDKVFDASVRGKLTRMKEQLL